MAEVIWSEQATENLETIYAYIANHRPRAAETTVRGIIAKVELLKRFPELGPSLQGYEFRKLRVLTYGHYRLVYRYADQSSAVELVGVYHDAMDLDQQLGSSQ